MQPVSLYLHIPFCMHRCGYCDFNTYAGLEALMPAYVDALIAEVDFLAKASPQKLQIHTIFFGGGTPSLLSVAQIEHILAALRIAFAVDDASEITMEANPGTVDLAKLQGFRAAGVNRLSFGVQSSNPEELRLLEREHDFADVINAVKWSRQAGFDNLNLDWIFGLPGQSLQSWQRNIELAIGLAPEHLSLYALSIEHGTPFKEMSGRGLLPEMQDDLAADMYEQAVEALGRAGYLQYEISNWAKADANGQPRACKHNLQYWRNLPYAGLGAGAHGFIGGHRTANVLAPAAYIKRIKDSGAVPFPRTPATASAEPMTPEREMGDTMMMGLRLIDEGISQRSFADRFGKPLEAVYPSQISRLTKLGLLQSVNGAKSLLRLTKRGRLLGNQVFSEFV